MLGIPKIADDRLKNWNRLKSNVRNVECKHWKSIDIDDCNVVPLLQDNKWEREKKMPVSQKFMIM